jgi:putative ABC transport system permease protein
MTWLSRRPSSQEPRLDLELRDHVERQVADYVAGGMTDADARRRVRLELGGLEQAKEVCRDVRPWQRLDELRRDVRIGFRGLARDRIFAVSVAAILTVGIGASVAMFSVLNTVVLRPLPYARPAELAMVTTHEIAQNRPDGTSLPNLFDWRRQSTTFAGMTFYLRTIVSSVTFAGRDAPQRVQEGLVGPEFFDLLGTPPLVGRAFSHEEFDRRERVVVLSEGLWQEQFAGSVSVAGHTLRIDGIDHTVIGVMPRRFQLPTKETRLWRPAPALTWWESTQTETARGGDAFEVIGRLAPGATLEEAQAEMQVIAARLRETHEVNQNRDIRIVPLFDHVVGGRTERSVWLGFAAVLSLLAIACANVGGLLSVRSARRRQEFAVRSALGAARARLVRQLLAESLCLWVIASAGGVLLALGLIRLLRAYGPTTVPRIEQLGLDPVAVGVAVLVGLVVVALCGTIPAVVAARTDAAALTVRDRMSLSTRRLQDWLVTGQIAGALILLIGAFLFARSFVRAQGEDPGYPADNLLIVRVDLPSSAYPDNRAAGAFMSEARDRLGRLPGVAAVGGMSDFFIRRNADQRISTEERGADPDQNRPRLAIEAVTPGFFDAVGIEVLDGRDFDDRDVQPGAPTVFIVNESLARRFWPGESAIGKRMVSGAPRPDGRWDTVVGVVKDFRREGLDVAPILSAFYPTYQRGMDLVIRAAGTPAVLAPAIRREFRAIDPAQPIMQISTAGDRLTERLGGRRFESQVLVAFAAVALVLSAAGLYAVLAYQVAIRRREIAVRAAIGATRQLIVGLIVGRGIRLAAIGTAVGVVTAAALSRALESLLYETAAFDPGSYAGVAAFVLVTAALAATVPALRAARVTPMTALRDD